MAMRREVERLSWLEKYLPSSIGGRITSGNVCIPIRVMHGVKIDCLHNNTCIYMYICMYVLVHVYIHIHFLIVQYRL